MHTLSPNSPIHNPAVLQIGFQTLRFFLFLSLSHHRPRWTDRQRMCCSVNCIMPLITVCIRFLAFSVNFTTCLCNASLSSARIFFCSNGCSPVSSWILDEAKIWIKETKSISWTNSRAFARSLSLSRTKSKINDWKLKSSECVRTGAVQCYMCTSYEKVYSGVVLEVELLPCSFSLPFPFPNLAE